MKLIVIKSNLKEGIGALERVGGDQQNLPVLRNFLIEADEKTIKLTATNLEMGVTFSLTGKTLEKGAITAPISVFSSIVNNLQSERLNIETKGNAVVVTTDNYEASVQGV